MNNFSYSSTNAFMNVYPVNDCTPRMLVYSAPRFMKFENSRSISNTCTTFLRNKATKIKHPNMIYRKQFNITYLCEIIEIVTFKIKFLSIIWNDFKAMTISPFYFCKLKQINNCLLGYQITLKAVFIFHNISYMYGNLIGWLQTIRS